LDVTNIPECIEIITNSKNKIKKSTKKFHKFVFKQGGKERGMARIEIDD